MTTRRCVRKVYPAWYSRLTGNVWQSDATRLPAESGAQQELVLRRLELQHLAVAHLEYLRHQPHGIFEQSVQFAALQRELAQLRQSGLLFRCAVRRILLLAWSEFFV